MTYIALLVFAVYWIIAGYFTVKEMRKSLWLQPYYVMGALISPLLAPWAALAWIFEAKSEEEQDMAFNMAGCLLLYFVLTGTFWAIQPKAPVAQASTTQACVCEKRLR